MIVLLDNYDSFVHNLARYLEELGSETRVVRNDAITPEQLRDLRPDAIVISPGPCSPNEAGISLEVVRQLGPTIPMLGVCLGHQAIVQAFGGAIVRGTRPVHGTSSLVNHAGRRLFHGLPSPLRTGRYHSLIAERASWPNELEVTAETEDGVIMACEHRRYPIFGVQFHPESILTERGHELLVNFLTLAGLPVGEVPSAECDLLALLEPQAAIYHDELANLAEYPLPRATTPSRE